jgi:ATP-binding cassette subfamily B protein
MKPLTNSKFIKDCLVPYKLAIGIMFSVAIVWAVHVSFAPYIVKILLDRATTSRDLKYLLPPVIGLIAVQLVLWIIIRLYDYFVSYKMTPNLRRDLAQKAITYIEAHSYNFFQEHLSGSIAGRLDDLSRVVPELIYIIIDRFLSHLLALIIAISVLWIISPFSAFAFGLWVAISSIVHYYFFYSKIIDTCEKWNNAEAENNGRYNDFFTNILSVKLFSVFKKEVYLQESMNNVVKEEQSFKRNVMISYIFYGLSFFLYQATCFYFLLKHFSAGWLTNGDFAFIIMINIQFADYIWQLTNDILRFSQYLGAYKQAFLYLSVPHGINDQPYALPLSVKKGAIEFKNIWFKYENNDFLFKKKNIKIFSGQKVGLVGYSGAGKSTFVNLLLRLFDVQKGEILIDEKDIRNVTQESLRNAIGVIPQDATLFHRTIFDNISYGKMDATEEEIIEAAKKSYAHDFIMQLPEGYNTVVGERGIKLSGGQRQRLAIARIFLKNAPILILDEPTSQLDSITEHLIKEALWNLMRDKTTLVIAHRLSTLSHMDRILVFNKGKIIQDGTHAILSNEEGLYKELLNKCIMREPILQKYLHTNGS